MAWRSYAMTMSQNQREFDMGKREWWRLMNTSLPTGLVCLHSDATLRKRLGLNAREHVRRNLSATVLDEKLGKFMDRVVGLERGLSVACTHVPL